MAHNPPITNLILGEYGYPFQLKARYANFIGGEWVPSLSGDYFVNLTPITGRPLCKVASSDRDDIDLALDAAHAARAGWGATCRWRLTISAISRPVSARRREESAKSIVKRWLTTSTSR